MISGTKTRRADAARARTRRALLGGALLLGLAPPALATAFDLAGLMALLARRKSGQARFTEEKTVAALDTPLRSSGTLAFKAPDRFTRVTLEPRAESMEVAGNQLTWKRGGRTRQMALDSVPEAALMVEAMRGTLAGDAGVLERHFAPRVAGSVALWTLTLEPKDPTLARQVRLLQITGQASDVRAVELQLASGDRSLMQIEPIDSAPARPTR